MAVKMIVSGGQTGADIAGIDAAIKLGAPHGGWIPKGRRTENWPLPTKYKLKEMSTTGYQKCTEQNILDSDGTVIFSHGKLTGGSKLTQQIANKHNKPCIHFDLNDTIKFKAASILYAWVVQHEIEILNVAGSSASKDPNIYDKVFHVITSVLLLDLKQAEPGQKLTDYSVE